MRHLRAFLFRFAALFGKKQQDRELADEIEAHIQLHTDDNIRAGMTPEEARRAAILRLGGVETAKEAYRDRRGFPFIETLVQDVRFSVRGLRRNPIFTAISVLTLAIGIGAVTSVYGAVDTIFLRPLPYPQSGRIMAVLRTSPRWHHPLPLSGADFLDWRERNHVFQQMAAYSFLNTFSWMTNSGAQPVFGTKVSASFFSVLGVHPLLGRLFHANEDQPGRGHIVVLGYGFWKKWFGGNPDVLSRSLILDGERYAVIGVLPKDFDFEDAPDTEIWVPLILEPNLNRDSRSLRAIGRLAPGVTIQAAATEMDEIARQLQREYPQDDAEQGITVFPLHTRIANANKDVVLMFLGGVVLLLLITCTNLAGLLLARSTARRKAFAMRAALGASRLRLVRGLLTESLLLGLFGGGAGIVMAYVLTPLLRSQNFIYLPRAQAIDVNARVLWVALGVSVLSGVLFGLAPALQLSRINLAEILKTGSGETALEGRWSLRSFLVAGEIALSVMLLTASGLLTRSMIRMMNTDPGYNASHLLTFWLTLPQKSYGNAEASSHASEEILRKIRHIPGVTSAGLTTCLPPSGREEDDGFVVVRHPPADMRRAPATIIDAVSPDYFKATGIHLIRGRFFTDRDNQENAQKVVIVSRSMAERFFGGEDPIGQAMKFEDDKNTWTVVGIVADTRFFGWDNDDGLFTYFPYRALGRQSQFAVVARTVGDPAGYSAVVRKAVWSVDPGLAPMSPQTMEWRLNRAFAPQRFNALLSMIFAGLAVALSCIGIFGLISYVVTQKTREIGIRMALGATRWNILGFVLLRACTLALAGTAVGLPCSLLSMTWLRSLLYGTTPLDATVFAVTVIVLFAAVVTAALVPGRRACSIDPAEALREN